MKRFLLAFTLLFPAGFAAWAQQGCQSAEYLQHALKRDPGLAERMAQSEAFNANLQRDILTTSPGSNPLGSGSAEQVIKIPVVVHILYNNVKENISDAQVKSQIEALNRDFRRMNADTIKTPAAFQPVAADCQIEFVLANVDPHGYATTGIVRRQTGIQFFNLDDRIKSAAAGGDDPWDPDSYLNIWVGSLPGALLGYASPLGGDKRTDGVVVSHRVFGTTGAVSASYNKGRIAVHEVGHWLGLRHIWGDRHCGDDYVDDTPPQQTSSFGCPAGTPVTCNNAPTGNMFMNYMDLTSQSCTNMFSIGQKEKMRSVLLPGGWRHSLLSSKGSAGNGLPAPVELPAEPGQAVVHCYPNPVQSLLTIDVSAAPGFHGQMITVYNHLGQPVSQVPVTKEKMQVNMRGLKDGMYFIRIGDDRRVHKVVKASE